MKHPYAYFEHDCPVCFFVMARDAMEREGIFPAGKCDVYVCPQMGWPTVVVRYGNNGWEYSSMGDHGHRSWFRKLYADLHSHGLYEGDRKSTRRNSSHTDISRMPSS